MRVLVVLAATVFASGVLAASAQPDPGSATNFRWTATFLASYFNGAHCIDRDTPGYGTSPTVTVPRVGSATLVFSSSSCFDPTSPTEVAAHLYVIFTTPTGDTLSLGSGDTGTADTIDAGNWHVLSATGRFASYSGSGTFTATYAAAGGPPPQESVTLSFVGSLSPSH